MIISVLGHPDSGKSTLISQILIQTGCIKNHEIAKIQKESNILKKQSNWLANIVDTDQNERESSITLQSSIESFNFNDKTYKILNNPGHSSLLSEIIKSTAQADISILLISANQNEFNKSLNTGYEYAIIARVLNINQLIICINKAENLNPHDYQIMLKQIKQNLKKLKSINYISPQYQL